MSDPRMIPAEKLREVVADHHIDMTDELMEALGALLPDPPAPPTMVEIEWDDLPWEVGDVAHNPSVEDLPDGVILVDAEGDAWRLADERWQILIGRYVDPRREWGPFEVVWLPKEDA